MPAGAALELRDVRRVFRLAGTELKVLNGVDLALRPGEIVALVGPSGAGKSTLLHVAGLLERPDGGGVLIGGEDCGGLSDERRTLLRRSEIGFVYQFHHLLPEFSPASRAAGHAAKRRSCSTASVSRHAPDIARRGCRAASSSGLRSFALSPTTPGSCWQTSRPATSTTRPATMC
jgi:lipoprotein-releasing system ATP-binding protein